MYIIFERKTTEGFKVIKYNLNDFKAVITYLKKHHRKGSSVNDEETRIIYYETDDELTDISKEYEL